MKKTILVLFLFCCCGLMSVYGCKQAQVYNTPTPSSEQLAAFSFKGVVVAVPYPDVVAVKIENGPEVSVKLNRLEIWKWKKSIVRQHVNT